MLDFVLTFSLPKLVFDNEVCGQCLHFVKELQPMGDLPTDELVAHLMREDHLITAPHTLEHWSKELYLTDPVIDRANRETWEETGSLSLYDRACQQVEERLANYTPIATDPAVDAALRQLVMDGLDKQDKLPDLPPPPEPQAPKAMPGRRGRAGRRRASKS
jgi:trimethylamine--corrinoid protein Co-methyltransferase